MHPNRPDDVLSNSDENPSSQEFAGKEIVEIESGIDALPEQKADIHLAPIEERLNPEPEAENLADRDAVRPLITASQPILSCPRCYAGQHLGDVFCVECGFIFPRETQSAASRSDVPDDARVLIDGRFQLGELVWEREGTSSYHGFEIRGDDRIPVWIFREAKLTPPPLTEDRLNRDDEDYSVSLLPEEETARQEYPSADAPTVLTGWPAVSWYQHIFESISHPALPRLLERIDVDGFTYLIVERPAGQSIWDAWDARNCTWATRCTWLIDLAEALHQLHRAGAILESLDPARIVITHTGKVKIFDLGELLPLPLAGNIQIRGSLYTAPELILNPYNADARADLYSFGATLHALLLGRELSDLDFSVPGMPRPYIERCPDAHPLLGRILGKTFVRDRDQRFPTDQYTYSDPSGFHDLLILLDAAKQELDRVQIELAGWTSTGIVRSSNEDAFAILHHQDALMEEGDGCTVLLLADGMGGMESGEVAASLAIQSLRASFARLLALDEVHIPRVSTNLQRTPIDLRGDNWCSSDSRVSSRHDDSPLSRSPNKLEEIVLLALREANQLVHDASQQGVGGHGMGCTAEVVVIDRHQVIIGHVGDSRVYHARNGALTQITNDQTLVRRLVEIGQLTPEEAETHPRRSELQQAIGGRNELYPDTHRLILIPGDWLLICSDGLSNMLSHAEMEQILRSASCAEGAARRLVNLANLYGATDNVTVIVAKAR